MWTKFKVIIKSSWRALVSDHVLVFESVLFFSYFSLPRVSCACALENELSQLELTLHSVLCSSTDWGKCRRAIYFEIER